MTLVHTVSSKLPVLVASNQDEDDKEEEEEEYDQDDDDEDEYNHEKFES